MTEVYTHIYPVWFVIIHGADMACGSDSAGGLEDNETNWRGLT